MSRAQPESKRGRNGKAISALLLAASVFALLRPTPLCAQETELRGEVSESAILFDQQRKVRQLSAAGSQDQAAPANAAAQANPPTPTTYLPASAGAVPDDTGAAPATGSLFDAPAAADDGFADDPPPAKPRRPSTAKQRATDADKTKDKAADKKKAKKTTDSTAATTAAGTRQVADFWAAALKPTPMPRRRRKGR